MGKLSEQGTGGAAPIIKAEKRASTSPLIQSVTRFTGDRGILVPDGCWDIVIMKTRAGTGVLLTGQTTAPVPIEFDPEDEFIGIAFRASVLLAPLDPITMLDQGRVLPTASRNSFWLGRETIEV